MAYIALELIISSINVKEAAPIHINNDKAKSKMTYKKITVSKVVANSKHLVVTPEQLTCTLNIGLYQVKKFSGSLINVKSVMKCTPSAEDI